MAPRDALTAIAALLAPRRAATISAAIALAIDDPRAYLSRNAKRMDARGVDKPVRELPWLALIEGLTAAKRLVEVDWKTSGVDLGAQLASIAPRHAVKWLADVDEIADERSTLELLEEAGKKLLAGGLQLAHLDLGSDSFCLVVAPPDVIARGARLAKAARLGVIEAFTGKGLAAAKRERVARQQRDAREQVREAKRAAKAAAAWRFFARGGAIWTFKQSPLAIDTCFEAFPRVKRYVHHHYPTPARCRAAAKDVVAWFKRGGYREITRAAYEKLPKSSDAYIGWVRAFPGEGHYWLEGKNIVRYLDVRGDSVVSTHGTVGRGFGELENIRHYASPAEARRELAALATHYDAQPKVYKRLAPAAARRKWPRSIFDPPDARYDGER